MDPAVPAVQPTNGMQKEPRRNKQKGSIRTKKQPCTRASDDACPTHLTQRRHGGGGEGAHLDAGDAPQPPVEDAVAMPPWYSSTAGCWEAKRPPTAVRGKQAQTTCKQKAARAPQFESMSACALRRMSGELRRCMRWTTSARTSTAV